MGNKNTSSNSTPVPITYSAYSPQAKPGKSIQSCPLNNNSNQQNPNKSTVPDKPCNLTKLKFTQPDGKPMGKDGVRSAEYQVGVKRNRKASPTLLESERDSFQIVAQSKRNPARKVNVEVIREAYCGTSAHKTLLVLGPDQLFTGNDTSKSLSFHRTPLQGDDGTFTSGLWVLLNTAFSLSTQPKTYQVTAISCGLPASAKGIPAQSIDGQIDVFPADQYKLSIEIPALLKPDALKLDRKTDSWKTEQELKEKKLNKEADAYFESEKEFFLEAGVSRSDVREFASANVKRESGEDDEDFVGQLKIEFSQTDGSRTVKAPVDDAIKLIRCIRSAEYALKSISKWLDNATVGPGASISIECQFFSGKLQATWGNVEYIDDRVFLYWTGAIEVQLIKLEIKIAIGWKCAGVADLFIEFGGEGAISIAFEHAKRSPDEPAEFNPTLSGEIKLSGKIKTQLMWAIKGETGVECTFKADVGEFKFMTKQTALGGKITISREPVFRVLTYSCSGVGETTEKEEVLKGDENLASFDFGS